ncbi:MAG: GGDEF and EAL domain-containing protein, partial [Chitinophagaceae bacterium]
DMKIEVANQMMLDVWGKTDAIIGKPFYEALPELRGQPFLEILQNVMVTGETYHARNTPAIIEKNGALNTYYFDFTYKPLFDDEGNVYGVMDMAIDVTEARFVQKAIEESQKELLSYFEQSPVGIAIITEQDLTFTMANPFYGDLVGRRPEAIIGKPLLEALPELRGQGFDDLLRTVIGTGIAYVAKEVGVDVLRDNTLQRIYVDLAYQPRREKNGTVSGVLVVATDVTASVLSRKELEESETKLRGILESAPAGIGLFVGRDLVIENPNQTFIDIVGKGPGVVGKPLREAMPELITEGQPFLKILDDVFTTGKMFQSYGSQVRIVQNGVMTYNYYNITYSPVYDSNGKVYAILDIAIDVTEHMLGQKRLEEAESALRSAIELAELGTWTYDIESGLAKYSSRLADWYGVNENANYPGLAPSLEVEDEARLKKAINSAIQNGAAGSIDIEYTVINNVTGQQRIIHLQGQTICNDEGLPLALRGTTQDITIQRKHQFALEQEVKLRTEQLAAAVEELQVTNEELEESNSQLLHSNDELAQYAYV